MTIDRPTKELLDEAADARSNAYAPYSEFTVGAALLCTDGTIYRGANIENINLTNTVHAEQVALHTAIMNGHRDFDAIAISTSGDPAAPCGLCRQSLSEFCDDDLAILVDGDRTHFLGELLPEAMDSIDSPYTDHQ